MPLQNFLSPEFMRKFQREVPLLLETSEFLFNTVQNWWGKLDSKASSIHSAVSIEHRLVTDTDRNRRKHRAVAISSASIASRG